MTITLELSPEEFLRLKDEAARLGTTPELLATERLLKTIPRDVFPPYDCTAAKPKSMLDVIRPFVGVVAGTGEPYSAENDRRFADGLVEDRLRRDRP